MWGWIGAALVVIVLYRLLFWGVNRFGGNTGAPVPELDWESYKMTLDPTAPWDVRALRVEFRDCLHKRICNKFRIAFLLQQLGLHSFATQVYSELRSIPLEDGSVLDLYERSEVFRHNWKLLKAHRK